MSGWLTALRIARREARRATGRTGLVVALIGLPVAGLSFAAVSYDMFTLTAEERLAREIGTADARLSWAGGPVRQLDATGEAFNGPASAAAEPATEEPEPAADRVRELVPGVERLATRWTGTVRARTATGVGTLPATAFDVTDPLSRGTARIVEGRPPGAPDEVALSAPALTRLGVQVGDRISLVESEFHPAGRYTVVGVVEFPDRLSPRWGPPPIPLLGDLLLAIGASPDASDTVLFHPDGRPGSDWPVQWLVSTGPPISWDQVRALNRQGLLVYSRAVALDPPAEVREFEASNGPGGEDFAVGALVAGLAILEIVLLAGPAFAVGARRRQRDLALVAAGGGTPAQLRRIVLADGIVLGGLGAAAGLLLGVATAVAARPLVEVYLVGARAGGVRVFPQALAAIAAVAVGTGLLAALVPAWTAARASVVAVLAGRRGSTGVRRRWLLLGLAAMALGGAVAGYGAWRVLEPVVLAGLVIGQLGLVLCTPSLIGLVARLGSRLPLTPRIALRDTARNRSAAAPAVSAIMAAVTGAAAAGVVVLSVLGGGDSWSGYPPGTVVVFGPRAVEDGPADAATRTDLERAARSTLPVDAVRQVSRPVCPTDELASCAVRAVVPPEQQCPYWGRPQPLPAADQRAAARDPRCGNEIGEHEFADQIDDGTALPVLTGVDPADLATAVATLRDGGVVVTDHRLLDGDGRVTVELTRLDETGESAAGEPRQVPGVLVPVEFQGLGVVLSPGAARTLGIATEPDRLLISTTRMPTRAEEDAFEAAMETHDSFGYVARNQGNEGVAPTLVLLAVAAGLIALGAAGIATGLAAADRRPDLATLAAVGASPRVRRGLSLSQAAVIAGLGTGLGLLAGLGAAVAALVALNQRYANTWPSPDPIPITVPWPNLAVLLAVPLVAMLGAGLLTRSRLPIERRPG